MNLEKYICDLLYRHECVIVPDFGGFITNYEPARIQSATHAFLPPRKFLVFNSNLTINDGLLATELSARLNCSFDEAMQIIRREVMIWQERLKAGKVMMLPGIGTFKTNSAGKTEFTPDAEQNFFDEAFGLKTMIVPPLQKQRKKEQPKFIYRKQARKTSPKIIRRVAWTAVIAIPLFLAGAWILLNFDTIRQGNIQSTGLVSFPKSDPEPIVSQTEETSPANGKHETEEFVRPDLTAEPFGSDENAEEEISGELAEASSPRESKPANPPPAANERAYHIIIGSFENAVNARDLANKLNATGCSAMVVESRKGMYRVSIASHVDKEEALKQLFKIREEQDPNAWLIRI